MSSDDSDDEPLSVLIAQKRLNPDKYIDTRFIEIEDAEVAKKKKKKFDPENFIALSIDLKKRKGKQTLSPPVIARPEDVWLYLKDFNASGPYSCLLCPEWFINRSKIILHYVVNHKKDFCGICRYFVPDRNAWWEHLKFHTPWPCSQCIQNFDTESDLRTHLSQVHTLVHCRLCHFRVSDDDQYKSHLFQKHNVTNVSSKDEDNLWELEYEGSPNFICLLCTKSNNITKNFFNHYMGYHHFTLKCFTSIISGRDTPFLVSGADLRTEFIEQQLKNHERIGYIDVESKPNVLNVNQEVEPEFTITNDSKELLKVLIPEIKQEEASGDENKDDDDGADDKKIEIKNEDDITKTYLGDEDFDVTLMELIILQKCYFDYVSQTLTDINANIVPQTSDIDYEKANFEHQMDIVCSLCQTHHETIQTFTNHMMKMHMVKSSPIFSCRVCATPFDSLSELDSHIAQELGDFDDLWICQFCDKEFDNRAATRCHLTQHFETIEYDNCFSPHLGFKCRYCPTLFWNESDRETHHVRAHFAKHKEDYYNCEKCNEMFSDKVWFIYHYLDKHNTEDQVPLYLLKCCICCLVVSNVEEMRNHFSNNHPEARKVYCSLDSCKYKPLSHRKSFKLHIKTIHNPHTRLERPVECSVCLREFGSSRACAAHMAQVHGTAKFKCKLCAELLHTNDERKLHYLIRHPGQHPFECSECGKSFQYKSSLYMHKQEHQPNKEHYKCTYCGKTFLKRDSYREHVQIHEGPRHACSYCPMRFVQRSNMLRHERRHTGERPYACPHCPRSFADKGACTSHARTHSKESSFACMYCGQTFVQKSKLTYHIRKHTGENLETCTVCSKLFTSACSLREHMKIHNSKKQTVKCPLCDKKYQDERYMLRHLRTAHTRGRFSCPICKKMLSSLTGLRHHVITHGNVKAFKCKQCPKAYSVKRTIIKHLRRRHGLKGTEINIKDFYIRLEPRQCELGLAEDVMESIFGPPKKKASNDVLLANFVTLTKKLAENQKAEEEKESEKSESEDEKSKESDKESESEEQIPIKIEKKSDSEQGEDELEPTDFVSVKIEPMDEDDRSYSNT